MNKNGLEMKASAERWLKPEDRARIERSIPQGYRMTVGYQHSPGEWNVRIYDADGALLVIRRNQPTILRGAFNALAHLAASNPPPMTVTVDLEDNPTLVGWVIDNAAE